MDSETARNKLSRRRRVYSERFAEKGAAKKAFMGNRNFLINLLDDIAKEKGINARAESLNGGSYSVVLKKKKEDLISLIFSSKKNGGSFNPCLILEGFGDKRSSITDLTSEAIRKEVREFADIVFS